MNFLQCQECCVVWPEPLADSCPECGKEGEPLDVPEGFNPVDAGYFIAQCPKCETRFSVADGLRPCPGCGYAEGVDLHPESEGLAAERSDATENALEAAHATIARINKERRRGGLLILGVSVLFTAIIVAYICLYHIK